MKAKRRYLVLMGAVSVAVLLAMWPMQEAVAGAGKVQWGACEGAGSCGGNTDVIQSGACAGDFSCSNNGKVIKKKACSDQFSCIDNEAVMRE